MLTHPQPQLNVDPGSNVSFSVVGEGSSVYHWYHNGAGIPDGVSRYVGSRESTMTILNVTQADEGLYSCVVGNNILSVLSDSAQLTLRMFVRTVIEYVVCTNSLRAGECFG